MADLSLEGSKITTYHPDPLPHLLTPEVDF